MSAVVEGERSTECAMLAHAQRASAAGMDALVLYARERAAEGAPVHIADVVRDLGWSRGYTGDVLQRATKQGRLIRLAARDGWVAADAVVATTARRRIALADLVTLARSRVRADVVGRRGRQALHASRDVEALSLSQLADIERLSALVLRHTHEAGGDAERVLDGAFTWDARANAGRGGWALAARVRTWAEAEHRAKHDARRAAGRGALPAWTPALAVATVRDYVGAANNLLHLAATAGLINRSPLAGGGPGGVLYAPSWVPALSRWTRWLRHRGGAPNPRRVHVGARTLAVEATRLGGRDVRTTDWLAVRRALESGYRAGTITRTNYEAARYVWRGACQALQRRLALTAEYTWPIAGDTRVALASESAIRAGAGLGTAAPESDFDGWVTADGRPARGLVEGSFGLRAYVAWSTTPDHLRRHASPPLGLRTWASESSITAKRRKGAVPSLVSRATLETRLRHLARVAGFAERERGVDWTTADLRTLVDPALVDAYVAWTHRLPPDPRGDRTSQLGDTVRTLAWMINGFLCSQAALAADGGLVTTLGAWYHRLEGIANEQPRPAHTRWRDVAAHVVATAQAWRGSDGVEGLVKIGRLIEALEGDLRSAAGGRSTAQQIDALQRGEWAPPRAWATTLRLIVVLLVAQRVPLRGETMVTLSREMWRSTPAGAEQAELAAKDRLDCWLGALGLEIPGQCMKSKRGFAPPLIRAEDVVAEDQPGSPARERGLRRPLLQLWFMDGGGRDICRTGVDPVAGTTILHDVPWLLPDASVPDPSGAQNPVRHAAARTRRGPRRRDRVRAAAPHQWTRAALSDAFRRAVLRHAAVLRIDVRALKRLRGALRFHVLRRLFGTYWAPRNLLWTSRLLDHRQIALTAAIYVAQDERTMSLDVAAEPG